MKSICRLVFFACMSAWHAPLVVAHAQSTEAIAAGGHGARKTESRPISGFSGIRIETPVNLVFTQTNESTLKVTAPDWILARLTTTVSDGRLLIRMHPHIDPLPPVEIVVGAPLLNGLDIAGSANVRAQGLSGRSIDLTLSGSGTVAMTGHVDQANVTLSGSGILDLGALQADHLNLVLSGSGQVRAFATQSARANMSGAGRVVIAGNPPQRSVQQSGAGSVVFQ